MTLKAGSCDALPLPEVEGASYSGPMIDRATDILGLVDVQPTFMPGGELAVTDGDAVVPVINRLLAGFDHAFATQDWHPPGHSSFASAHPGHKPYDTIAVLYGQQVLWPDHAIQGSPNAALHRDLDLTRVEVVIRKGFHRDIDSYSTFFENDRRTATGLDGWLRQRGFRRLFLAGLATDFCVAWSAEDAVRLGYEVMMVEDACRGIGVPLADGRTTMDETRERLAQLGVQMVSSAELGA
jgi:nicotinamidase/pyrazinamidase